MPKANVLGKCPCNGTFTTAAQQGNLGTMMWLLKSGFHWVIYTFIATAEHGNLENMVCWIMGVQ